MVSAVLHLISSHPEHFCWVSGFTRDIDNLKDIQNDGTRTVKENEKWKENESMIIWRC